MNNNENNNDGLNAISLGSVDGGNNPATPISNIPTITPTIGESNENLVPEPIPVQEVQTAPAAIPEVAPIEPVAPIPMEEIPKVDEIPMGDVSNSVIGESKGLNEQNLMSSIDAINGDIGSVPPPVQEVAPVAPIDPLPTEIKEEPKKEVLEPVAPVDFDVPETINNFNPSINDIGTVPPIPNIPVIETPTGSQVAKKKGVNKGIFVLIVVLALAAVAVGVYILLHLTQEEPSGVKVKDVSIEIGSKVSTDINDYAIFKGIDASTCSLDTTQIPNELDILGSEYTFRIECNGEFYSGIAKVVDNVAPEVKLKEVTVPLESVVTPEDFIDECIDATECSYSFVDEEKVKEYLKEAASYHVAIEVQDTSGNKKEVTATLIVSEKVFKQADLYLNVINDNVTLKLGIDDGNFNESAMRTYLFTFTSADDYNKLKTENAGKTEITYNNVTGSAIFNDDDMSVAISEILSYDDLNREEDTTLPLVIGELRTYYENKGYSCSYGF